jgi:hypothetical protein
VAGEGLLAVAAGHSLTLYLTLLSGALDDRAEAVAADGYVAGASESSDFPAAGYRLRAPATATRVSAYVIARSTAA